MKRSLLISISLLGLFLSGYAVITAVFVSKLTWYGYLTIGNFLLLSPISYQLRRRHTLLEFSVKCPLLLIFLYLVFFAVGAVIDLFYGRSLANFWYYPRYSAEQQAFHNLLIGYPFAFLSVIPLYEICEHLFLTKIPKPPKARVAVQRIPKGRWVGLMIVSIVLVVMPVADSYWLSGTHVRQLCILGMVGAILLADSVRELVHGTSFVAKIARGDYRHLLSLITAGWLAALINEVPNTIPDTWVYQNIPFIERQFLGVNMIVFFVGWPFLTFIAVSVFRFFEEQSRHNPKFRSLTLERPAGFLGIHYFFFWFEFALLLVLMRQLLLVSTEAQDPYAFLSYFYWNRHSLDSKRDHLVIPCSSEITTSHCCDR
jgi:hypothetical protein